MVSAIAKKKLKTDGILFCGENANDVTGSCTYIRFAGKQILLECGLYQDNSYLESYKINSKKFKFNPEEIDYVFVEHVHIDHIGLLPRLVSEGFTGRIIMTKASAVIAKHLLLNCAFILEDEARVLSKRYSSKGANVINTALMMGHNAISVENIYTHATEEGLSSVTTPSQAILADYKKEDEKLPKNVTKENQELYEAYLKLKEIFE